MLREIEFFHGVLFARLVREFPDSLEIGQLSTGGQSAYLLQRRLPIYVKYSTSRLTPWSFTFAGEHVREMETLLTSFQAFLLCLICHEDGIVGLTGADVRRLIGPISAPYRPATISVQRRRRELYSVRGSAGELPRKVSESAVIRLVVQLLDRTIGDSER